MGYGQPNLGTINKLWAEAQGRQDWRNQANIAKNLPGYKQMGGLYDRYLNQQSPDYMEKFAGMVDPMSFLQPFLGGDGSGGYAPIGTEALKDYGEGMYELFDKFRPGMEYIAENQGVGEAELANRLGTASSRYQGNIANQEAQAQRAMGRMGVNPNSGAWQAGAGQRAMQGAAGLSGLQQQVRQDARTEDWQQRLQAAGVGLQAGQQGTDALGRVASEYSNMLGSVSGLYGNYMGALGNMANTTEGARQYDKSYLSSLAGGMTGAMNDFTGMRSQNNQASRWQPLSGNPQSLGFSAAGVQYLYGPGMGQGG